MLKKALIGSLILSILIFGSFSVIAKEKVTFWSTDNEPKRVKVYEKVADEFMAEHPDVNVEIVPIDEAKLSQRIAAAVAAGNLPDIIRCGVGRVSEFTTEGILDENAAERVIKSVGKADFRDGPLSMVVDPATDKYAAIPYDGWIQALWYRKGLFKKHNLTPPVSWADINAAVDKLPKTEDVKYALTLGTDPGSNYPRQLFEQIAISNDAWPFDKEGNVTMDTPEMVAALDFYTSLQRGAVPGPHYWRTARETYELGQTAMLFYSTYIVDDLVKGSGLGEGGKVEIPIENLPQKTGFAPKMVGPHGSATYGQLVTLVITEDASSAATKVAEYYLTEGYIDILDLSPFGKVPVLESAVDEWKTLSPFFQQYSSETLSQIANGYENIQRWLFQPDYGPTERAVISAMQGQRLIPKVINKIAIEGIMTPEQGAEWLQDRVENILAEQKG